MSRITILHDDNFVCFSEAASVKEVSERISIVIHQDEGIYARRGQVRQMSVGGSTVHAPGTSMDAKCRQLIGEWCYRLADKFELDREVVLTSFYFIDRFLMNEVQDGRPALLRILSMTALLLASKLHGSRDVTMKLMGSLGSEVQVSLLAKMELLLLRSLRWQVHPPTAKTAIRELLRLLAPRLNDYQMLKQVSEYAHYFAELSALDPKLVSVSVVTIAAGSILNALELIGGHSDLTTLSQLFLDDFCSVIGAQNHHLIDHLNVVQDHLWVDYLLNQECAFLRSANGTAEQEPTPKRRRRDSPVSPMHIFP